MREKGVLNDFLKNHKYDPGLKYRFGNFGDFSVLYEPIAYMDVSLNTTVPAAKAEGSPSSHPGVHCWKSLSLGRDPY